MLKFTCLLLFIVAVNFGNGATFKSPYTKHINEQYIFYKSDLATKWRQHIMDFLNLIDINEIVQVVMAHIQDPEVQEFIQFIMSPKMTEIIMDFESIEEFKEAVDFLESEGYQARYIVNIVNSFLKLPPLEETKMLRQEGGMIGFIKDIIAVIPGEEMQELFESKLENNPEVAELFETVTAEEFVDIIKRLFKNPKFIKIQETLESYSFGPMFVCTIAQGILGDDYHGIMCE